MADTPVNPAAGFVAITGYTPLTVQRQPGLDIDLWVISTAPDILIAPISDPLAITIQG